MVPLILGNPGSNQGKDLSAPQLPSKHVFQFGSGFGDQLGILGATLVIMFRVEGCSGFRSQLVIVGNHRMGHGDYCRDSKGTTILSSPLQYPIHHREEVK